MYVFKAVEMQVILTSIGWAMEPKRELALAALTIFNQYLLPCMLQLSQKAQVVGLERVGVCYVTPRNGQEMLSTSGTYIFNHNESV